MSDCSASDIAVHQEGGSTEFLEVGLQHACDVDGAVLAAGASDGDGEVVSVAVLKLRENEAEHRADVFEECSGGVLFFQEVDDFGFFAGAGSQGFDPVGVGEEADIKEHIGVHGRAVFETKREDRDAQSLFFILDIKGFAESLSELAGFKVGGIEDQVGFFAEGGEECAFAADTFGDSAMIHGVRPSAFGITSCEDIVLAIEEKQAGFVAKLLKECAKGLSILCGKAGLTGVCDDGDAFERGVAGL